MKPDPAESAMTWLRDRRLLLVIDNCEHVLEAVATVVEHVLRRAPHAKVLATSSEALRADGEWVQRVGGLAAPRRGDSTDRAQALRAPAVELLLSKSGIDDGGQHLSDAEVAAAVEICRSVEGTPLAIELAASRVRMLGLRHVVDMVSDPDGLLGENRCATLPRHQSLRAAMDWSCGLLGDEEAAVLRRLAIFPGAFPLRAAVFVGQCPRIDERLTASCVVSLVNRSLVSLEKSQAQGVPLYRLMATTRAYALQSLVACGEVAAIQCRHAQWCEEASGSSGPAAADRLPA
jgi:predicted ATPase